MKLKQLTLALLAAVGLMANAANTKTTVAQVTDGVKLTTDVDYIITGDTPFATTGSVDIVNTDHAVLIISSIKPSKVLSGNLLKNVYINGVQAQDGVNCQVKMYSRGTIIFPYASDIQPLTCYTEQNYGGEACSNYSEGHSGGYMKTLTTNLLNNKIRSFKLKRGYMVTFAIGTGGWGYSRCFIADQEDLEVATLPDILDQRISSYRLFKWHNAHKAGLASSGNAAANQALNTSWCYDWAQGNASNLPDTEWVPNHIYEDYPSSSTCGSVTGSCHMKANNEPANQSDDTPQSVATILNNWQNLMRTGMRLCTPSSWDGSDYWNGTGTVIKVFLDSIDARGWRCDIVDAHCYWPAGNFNYLQQYWWPNYKRPIWISEWIWGASWNNNGAFASGVTDAQIVSNTRGILDNLNSMACVERYAYWNGERTGHIYENGALTELGKYYSTMNVGLGYNSSYQKIPNSTRLANMTNFTSSAYDRKKGTVSFSWTDPNGDLTTNISVQCKLPETSTFKTIATVTPKDMSSSAGATYTYTDTIFDPGVYTYRIKATTYNNKTFTTDDISVDVAPAQGTEEIQYGKLTISSLESTNIYYSEAFSVVPCTFIGTQKNTNATLYTSNYTAKSKSQTYFSFQLLPWQTNTGTLAKNEEVPFLALKEGNYKYGDIDCEVKVVKSNAALSGINWTDTTEVVFDQPFPEGVTPVILTEIRPTGTTANVYCTRVFDVTNTGFKFIIYPEDAANKRITIKQNVCYLAIAPGIGYADEENGIVIAAGHGTDNQIYGSTARENKFYVEVKDEESGTTQQEVLRLYQPTILTALQTDNYPAVYTLKRTDVTEKDAEGIAWTTGTKIKKISDHDITVDGKTIKSGTTDEAYRENLGWVVIAKYREGGSKPTVTAIRSVNAMNESFKTRVVDGRIQVDGVKNFEVFSAAGTKVASDAVLTPGIYVVKTNNKSVKVLVK